jgi:DNA-binding CsgD family transcriptional regulator
LSPIRLAAGFGLTGGQAVPTRVEESFLSRLEVIASDTRLLLLVAAADPVGDPVIVWGAAEQVGVTTSAATAAETERLLEIGAQVRFRHPLMRSAVYRSASPEQRRRVHLALAEATDPRADPERRAWHLAEGTAGPDEDVAAELERSSARARARGGMAAAAAFLERAVALTPEPARRAERALAAAQANFQAGAFDAALELLAKAQAGPMDELHYAQVELLRGRVAFASNAGSEAPALLLNAANRIEPLDIALARETYLDAWHAALFAGRFARAGTVRQVSQAARSARQPTSAPRPSDLLLDGLALLGTEGRAAAATKLRHATRVFAEEESAEDRLRWGWAATIAAYELWDDELWHALAVRGLQSARGAGLLALVPGYLNTLGVIETWRGNFAMAASLIAEADAVAEATGIRLARYAAVTLAGFQGAAEASALIEVMLKDASAAGEDLMIQWCHFVSGILFNGLGRYEEALAEAERASEQAPELYVAAWALSELIEAATRTGRTRLAVEALARLADATSGAATDWGLGIQARSRALLAEGQHAEGSYREAIDRLSRIRLRPELARAHLLYGEWLRREGRRVDARAQLRSAHQMFVASGMEAFAERARRELAAAGETARKRTIEARDELTPQEAQIAHFARSGLSNPEIAAQLFLSPRTVEYHLRKVFTKLEISSRHQLERALPGDANAASEA